MSHPAEVKVAHAPLLALLTDLMTQAEAAGELRPATKPRRAAALTMETVMFVAQNSGVADEDTSAPITADEIWTFCSTGFASCS